MTTIADAQTCPKVWHVPASDGSARERPSSVMQAQKARQRERVRSEVHALATLREAVPLVPERVATPVRHFIAGLDALRGAQPVTYVQVYAAYMLARARVLERQAYLIDYGHALLDVLPAGSPEARELATRLARTVADDGHSLASLLTSQCALDRVLGNVERVIA